MSFREPSRPREPKSLEELIDGLSELPGWRERLALGRLRRQWALVAGEAVAAQSEPVRLEEAVLTVRVESGAWATELSLLAQALATRAASVLGAGWVREVRVVSPPTGRGGKAR